ncbi:MAG: competence/damage-inducible protein A [Chloroflexia bacterium]|nr:competence/damage-inducible protein A [Chloroflexia bacterium]
MRAYVISIGSELIGGHLTDTNATFLAQELAAQGIELLHVIQVGDDLERLTGVLATAAAGAELVICTGGIGPTDDDLTREAISTLAGETPEIDQATVAKIREFFAQRGLEMPERNAKQAWVIPSVEVLPNPVGTAPGWLARIGGAIVVAMPGVPREMFRMWREQALPRISAGLTGRVYRSANLRTLGIGESAVSQLLDELTQRPQPYIGTYAKDDGVHVRITASADRSEDAEAVLAETVAEVRRRLTDYIYADDDRSLALVLLDALRKRALTIGIAEAGSGGRFGSLLLSEPASAGVVRGISARDADPANVVAADLAQTAREQFGSDVGVGITAVVVLGTQGLYEGTIEVVVSGTTHAAESFPIRAAYQEIQRRSAMNAADVLRLVLAKT